MEILAPILNETEVRPMVLAGCTEFYFGYVPESWLRRYTSEYAINNSHIMISPNKRSGVDQSIIDTKKGIALCNEIKKQGKKIFLALNAFGIVQSAYYYLDEIMDTFGPDLVDGYIVTDVGLIHHLHTKWKDTKVILSTCQMAINSENVKFFQDIGVQRITFTRHMSLKEIQDITNKVPDMEYELFGLDGKCMYDESNCRALHCAGQFCLEQFEYTHYIKENFASNKLSDKLNVALATYANWPKLSDSNSHKWPPMGCTLCNAYEFTKCGITTFKISGRGVSLSSRMSLVNLTKNVVKIAEQTDNPNEARQKIVKMCSKVYPTNY